jgi:hypothetical protein
MQVLALVAVVTTAIVGALKKAWPTWMTGKEELFAIVVPIAVVPILKLTHVSDLTWANVVITILFSGVGAGVLHDKLVNPLLAGKKKNGEVK